VRQEYMAQQEKVRANFSLMLQVVSQRRDMSPCHIRRMPWYPLLPPKGACRGFLKCIPGWHRCQFRSCVHVGYLRW